MKHFRDHEFVPCAAGARSLLQGGAGGAAGGGAGGGATTASTLPQVEWRFLCCIDITGWAPQSVDAEHRDVRLHIKLPACHLGLLPSVFKGPASCEWWGWPFFPACRRPQSTHSRPQHISTAPAVPAATSATPGQRPTACSARILRRQRECVSALTSQAVSMATHCVRCAIGQPASSPSPFVAALPTPSRRPLRLPARLVWPRLSRTLSQQ